MALAAILAHEWPQEWLRRSRSFKVTDLSINRKPVYGFLLVNNTNLHPISHRLAVIMQYLSNYRPLRPYRHIVYVSQLKQLMEQVDFVRRTQT